MRLMAKPLQPLLNTEAGLVAAAVTGALLGVGDNVSYMTYSARQASSASRSSFSRRWRLASVGLVARTSFKSELHI